MLIQTLCHFCYCDLEFVDGNAKFNRTVVCIICSLILEFCVCLCVLSDVFKGLNGT